MVFNLKSRLTFAAQGSIAAEQYDPAGASAVAVEAASGPVAGVAAAPPVTNPRYFERSAY